MGPRHLEGNVTTRDIIADGAGLCAADERGKAPISSSRCRIPASVRPRPVRAWKTPRSRWRGWHGIDAIVTGHSHLVFPSPTFDGFADVDVAAGTISGKPAVMAGFWGSHLGLIDLLLERDGGQLAGGLRSVRGAADLAAQRGSQRRQPWSNRCIRGAGGGAGRT